MPESIIIHLRDVEPPSVTTVLSDLARGTATGWGYPAAEPTVIVGVDDHALAECDDDELKKLQHLLGAVPSFSLQVEFRRAAGDRAIDDARVLVVRLLQLFDGVVDDTFSELWTRAEIEADATKTDGGFLDCYRQVKARRLT